MKSALCGAASAAILACVAGASAPSAAWAQQSASGQGDAQSASQDATNGSVGEVVVTGSLIRGTSVEAALPVEVYSSKDLERRGSPTALDFAKSLTISGPTTGEAYYFGGTPPGSVQYNLRDLGSSKTLILLNGRRMSSDTSNIPSIALARTEILKDGAAVTYGADATGGVVNFITKDHFVGLQAQAQYKYIANSDGDYQGGILGGVGDDRVNFMVSGEYEHRSRLKAIDRDFTKNSFDPSKPGYNPAPWSTLTNLTGWQGRGALPAIPSVANEFGAPVGGLVSDFTPSTCAAVGGRYDNAYTCAYNYASYYDLVENTDIYRGYAQLNAAVSDKMKFHLDVSYAQTSVPEAFGSPAQPVARGPALATGAVNQFYVPISNPFAAEFAAKNGIVGVSGFTPTTYRLLGHGGNSALSTDGFGVPDRIGDSVWRVSGGLQGDVGDFGFAKDIHYDTALTYNSSSAFNTHADTVGFRLQEALDGFGGPDCHAADLDPNRFGTQNAAAAGKNGCQYWNPFSSSFAKQPVRNLPNPNYVPGDENSAALTRWMFDPRATQTDANNLTADVVFDGKFGAHLPGGDVSWALGGQFRTQKFRTTGDGSLYNGGTPCEWPSTFTSANGPGSQPLPPVPLPTTDPNFRGCTPDAPGPFVVFTPLLPANAEQRQHSFFGELDIPVFDRLNVQAAVRHEQFSGDLSATVYKLSSKWNVWGPLSLRASYGTNYQTPPIGTIPGQVRAGAANYTIAGGNWLVANFTTAANIKPETAELGNVGAIWESRGFSKDHSFRVILDYFDIRTKDEIGQIADPNQIANLVFNGPGGTISTCDPAVQPLINRVTFNSGCAVGMSAVTAFSAISTVVGNGPGQKTNGIDLQADYGLPLGPGDLDLNLTATQVLELRTGPTSLDGVVISTGDDRLGTLNFATIANAAPRLRANLAANYHLGSQNFRLGVNFVSAVRDERVTTQYGKFGQDWITADFTYRKEFRNSLALTATVSNIFDRDPPPAQEELGYDPRMGNALGRTVQLGLTKVF